LASSTLFGSLLEEAAEDALRIGLRLRIVRSRLRARGLRHLPLAGFVVALFRAAHLMEAHLAVRVDVARIELGGALEIAVRRRALAEALGEHAAVEVRALALLVHCDRLVEQADLPPRARRVLVLRLH